MKDSYGETVVSKSSGELIAGPRMASTLSAKAMEPSGSGSQDISSKKYRVEVESKFHCKETGIKFVVESKTTIEYSLEYESDYVTWVQDNGYELLGPIFNVQVRSGQVSAVHLPHYVQLEGIKDKSMIKIGHFKDKKVTLKIPTKIEPNYVLLKDPSFSCIAVVGEHSTSIWRKKKPTPFHGKVRLYFRVLCAEMEEMEYRIHLYLLPADVPQL
ncbi:LRR and PYD domains-containing protein 1-like, partial [Pristimantis euphronides]